MPTAVATPSAIPTKTALPTRPAGPSTTPTPIPYPSATPTLEAAPPSGTPAPVLAVTITHIKMFDTLTGWAEGEVEGGATRIFRTTDGGRTWRDVSPLADDDNGISFLLDGQVAWVSSLWGPAQVWRTEDGGQTWTSLEGVGWSHDVWFNDNQHGWKESGQAGGMSAPRHDITSFAVTQDGGQTWEEVNPPPGDGFPFLAFPDERTAWVIWAAKRGAVEGSPNLGAPIDVLTSFDGGRTWTPRMLPLPPETFTVEIEYEGTFLGGVGNCDFISPVYSSTSVWKAALTCESRSWMYTSANQGRTWIISAMPAGLLAEVEFVNPTVGWLHLPDWEDPEGRLYRTTDGGQTWALLKRTGWRNVELSFVDTQTGWAVVCPDLVCYYEDSVRAFVKTADGGRTWQTLEPQLTP